MKYKKKYRQLAKKQIKDELQLYFERYDEMDEMEMDAIWFQLTN